MKTLVGVGSTNPAKVEAVKDAFALLGMNVEVIPFSVESGVSAQPFSDEETIQGARNRCEQVFLLNPELHFAVGLEGGVVETPHGLFLCNWGVVRDRQGRIGVGGGPRIPIPTQFVESLRAGMELGKILDAYTGKKDARMTEGLIGFLTHRLITRRKMYRDVIVCAFTPFRHPHLYLDSNGADSQNRSG